MSLSDQNRNFVFVALSHCRTNSYFVLQNMGLIYLLKNSSLQT